MKWIWNCTGSQKRIQVDCGSYF